MGKKQELEITSWEAKEKAMKFIQKSNLSLRVGLNGKGIVLLKDKNLPKVEEDILNSLKKEIKDFDVQVIDV